MTVRILTAVAAVLVSGATAADDCPAGGAVYRLEATDRFGLTLAPLDHPSAVSDLGPVLSDRTTGGSWAFGLTASNGYSMDYLVPGFGEEIEALEVFFFVNEEGFAGPVRVGPPQSADRAPDFLLVPRLGTLFWYDMPERIDIPTEMWVLSACGSR